MSEQQTGSPHPRLGLTASTGWGVLMILVYVLVVSLPVILSLRARSYSGPPAEEMGLSAALLGFSILAMQVVLAGRFHWADQPFGLDILMRFHQVMAVVAGLLLLSHPILLSIGDRSWHLFAWDTGWQIWLGKIALLFLILAIIYAIAVHVWNLAFQTWRRLHKGMIIVLILGFIHSLLLGHDFHDRSMLVYWISLFSVAMLVFVWRNVVVALGARRKFRVSNVLQASHDTWTVQLEADDGKDLPARNPGQFMFLRLKRPGRPTEEHPWTISASPTEDVALQATIKKSGDFTDTIDRTQVGDEARVEFPFGRFSYVHHEPERLVFIAGGVGITPIHAMLRHLADIGDQRPAVLIYANHRQEDILFARELEKLPDHVRVVHVLSKPDEAWDGPTGHVDKDILQQHAGDHLDAADCYVCGPPKMISAVVKHLKELNVEASRIHYERFSL